VGADRPDLGAPPPSPLREHDALARAMAGVVRLPAALAGVEQRLDRIESALRGLRRILPPVLVPLPEAARILGVSYATIRRMKKDGRLPLVGSGRTARVDLTAMHAMSDLEVTLEARRARAEPGPEDGDGEP
jgi:excisionase family DNA binding protein